MQIEADEPPVKRWSSWYDPCLVTKEGEEILTEFDTWAISELRKHKLVWTSWGPNRSLRSLHDPMGNTSLGLRKVEGIDPKELRLFFLSLLWRAAATDLPEFAEVHLPQADLERLRLMILARETEPISFYPAHLTQLSTIGDIHNFTPIADSIGIEDGATTIPTFRFYFDGLITHIHRHASDGGYTSSLGSLVVGAAETLVLLTVTYEDSFQLYNLINVVNRTRTRDKAVK
jgi:hypothetical protein